MTFLDSPAVLVAFWACVLLCIVAVKWARKWERRTLDKPPRKL